MQNRSLYINCVILFICFSSNCVALLEHVCIFDFIRKQRSGYLYPYVREIPVKINSTPLHYTHAAPEWAPIRIKFFLQDLLNPLSYCRAVGEQRRDFRGSEVMCTEESILSPLKNSTLVNTLIPGGVRLHADRLLVRPFMGSMLVPKFSSKFCRYFSVPSHHRTTGVYGADTVLYVAAAPTSGMTLAWSMTCAWLKNKRPAVGIINFGPQFILTAQNGVRVTAHEIAHALGFNYEQMKALKMVSKVYGVRKKPHVTMILTERVRNESRRHYGCPTAQGMELEDEGGRGTADSHWERRNAKDELMAGVNGIGYYTALTMSVFHDMGFYHANWGMEESMGWGKGAGCDLLTKPCLTNGTTNHPDMFCDKRSEDVLLCTADRLALGYCSIRTHEKVLSSSFQYFADPNIGGTKDSLMDYCPVITAYSNSQCKDGSSHMILGSRLGPNSRCLKGEGLRHAMGSIGDVCADVDCSNGTLRVQLLGDERWHLCPEGQFITPLAFFTGGRVKCPAFSDVCTVSSSGNSFITTGNSSFDNDIFSSFIPPDNFSNLTGAGGEHFMEQIMEFGVIEWAILLTMVLWLLIAIHLLYETVFPLLRWIWTKIWVHVASKYSSKPLVQRRNSCPFPELCMSISAAAK